jgi:hypothetical protein
MTASTDQTALVLPIDASHIRALRNADSVVFRLYKGQATVEANMRAESSRDGFEHQTTIYADHAVTDYERTDGYAMSDGPTQYSAFEMFHSGAKYSDELGSLVGRLAKGDVITLIWRRGAGSTEGTRNAGMIVDDLQVRITKPSGKRETYLLAYQACDPNSSARMVRKTY